jgi:hypothetical protein
MTPLEKTIEFYTQYILSDNFHSLPDKEQVLNRVIKVYTLFFSTDRKIIDIQEEVKGKKFNQTIRDFLQYNLILGKGFMDLSEEDIKKRFSDDYEGVCERMLIRIELFKDGWDADKIESYIYKFILKEDKPCIDAVIRKNYYNNLMSYIKAIKNEKTRSKGRPKLPDTVREIVNKIHLNKVRENMRRGYKKQNMFEEVNDVLFTLDEIQILEEKFKDKEDPLLIKIRKLYKRDV